MTKLRVFISHSSKDFVQAGPAPSDPAEIARRKRLRYATQVREEIVKLLDPQLFDVLLDVRRLEPGDEWRARLHLWLQTCDAALILLGVDAIASEWVRKETEILLHRRFLRRDLLVIPVLLGEVTGDSLKERGFDAGVLEPQAAQLLDRALTEPNAIALAKKAVAPLRGLAPVTTDEPVSRWVDGIVTGLVVAGGAFLERARRKVDVIDEDWSDDQQRLAILAYHLLRSPLRRVVDALTELRAGYAQWEPFEQLTKWLLPVWVDEAAATRLLEAPAVNTSRSAHILAINGTQTSTGVDYVMRAWCCPPWDARITEFNPPIGEGQEAELPDRIRDLIWGALGINEQFKHLLKPLLANGPFVVILGTNVPVLHLFLEQIAKDYAPVTFIVMAGAHFERLGADADSFVRIRPEMNPDAEEEVFLQMARIYAMRPVKRSRSF